MLTDNFGAVTFHVLKYLETNEINYFCPNRDGFYGNINYNNNDGWGRSYDAELRICIIEEEDQLQYYEYCTDNFELVSVCSGFHMRTYNGIYSTLLQNKIYVLATIRHVACVHTYTVSDILYSV